MDQRPIGMFDSGLGGLTAAKALLELAPGENTVYFGDSANVPYGTKSLDQLSRLADANARFLLEHGCKAILVACGTVSSTVIGALREKCPVPVIGVIDAVCARAAGGAENPRVAVIATEATVASGAFEKRLRSLNADCEVFSKPCQSLVRVAEAEGFAPDSPETAEAVAAELEAVRDWAPDRLILACTHFPLLESAIADYMGRDVQLLSAGAEAAAFLTALLRERGQCSGGAQGTHLWFTSGDTRRFDAGAARFLGFPVKSQYHRGFMA